MNRTVCVSLAGLMLLAGPFAVANAQQCVNPNGFTNYFSDGVNSGSGLSCSYNVFSPALMTVGCWATGACNVPKDLHVAFYQWWVCNPGGSVTASGNSYSETTAGYCPSSNDWEYFVNGVGVNAIAQVKPSTGGFLFRAGWESMGCEVGAYSYSGPFTYSC